MALKGVLQRDGCADVFQLLGRQNKTGVLRIRGNPFGADLWLQQGIVVRVDNLSRDARGRLGEMLVRAGLLSREQLDQSLRMQKDSGKRLGSVLMEAGYVDRRTLIDFVKLQAREALFNAFCVTRGTYEFLADLATKPAAELAPGIRWEHALMEGVRRLGEWPDIRKVIPSNGYTFKILKDLPDAPEPQAPAEDEFSFGGLDDLDAEMAATQSDGFPQPNDHLVFALVRPGASVQRLADQSYLGEFETCRVLLGLVKRGYLETVDDEEELSVTDMEVVVDAEEDDAPPLAVTGSLLDPDT